MVQKLSQSVFLCYNEEENVRITYETVKRVVAPLRKYTFKFLFTDNGGTDKTRAIITALAKKDKKVQGVFLSRNFGIEASFAALVDHAEGDAMIMLFCDLQDPAELIPEFIKKWEQGNNMVVAKYTNTEDDMVTLMLRRAFYFVFRRISSIDVPVNASGVGLIDRKSIDVLKSLPERYRFFRGLRAWIGFKSAFVLSPQEARARREFIQLHHAHSAPSGACTAFPISF
jgi:glycosyltransferase involved in cell wall biosynthesis